MGCLLFSDDGDECVWFASKMVRARKQHECYECHRQILPGEMYENARGVWRYPRWNDRMFDSYKTCASCHDIRETLNCGSSFLYGELWEVVMNGIHDICAKDLEALTDGYPAMAQVLEQRDAEMLA